MKRRVIQKIAPLLALVALMGSLFGCAYVGLGPDGQVDPAVEAASKIAIQYGVLRFIGDDQERAVRVRVYVEVALSAVDDSPTSIEDLSARLQALVPWERLEPADRMLVTSLAALLTTELKRRVAIPAAVPLAEVRVLLGWIEEAATLAVPLATH